MKKIIAFIVIIFSICIVEAVLIKRTNISVDNAKLIYIYDDKNIEAELTSEESIRLKDFFNNKILYSDNPSCGFTENVSICFGDKVFCIACDTCPIIKFKNKYFTISESQRKEVNQIFQKYNCSFPCV